MKPEMMQFLQQGLESYSEARATLTLFEQEFAKLLSSALEKRMNWSPLLQHSIGKASADWDDVDGSWIHSVIDGRSAGDGDVAIECGIWWEAPIENNKPILYAGFYDKPKRARDFDWPATNEPIKSLKAAGHTYLYLPAPKSLEFEAPLNRLLDAVLRQLA